MNSLKVSKIQIWTSQHSNVTRRARTKHFNRLFYELRYLSICQAGYKAADVRDVHVGAVLGDVKI